MFLKDTLRPYCGVIVREPINHDIEIPGQLKTGIRF